MKRILYWLANLVAICIGIPLIAYESVTGHFHFVAWVFLCYTVAWAAFMLGMWLLAPARFRRFWGVRQMIIPVILAVTITSTVAAPYISLYEGGNPQVSVHTAEAHAQAEEGGLLLYALEYTFPYIKYLWDSFGLGFVLSFVVAWIYTLMKGRPDVGLGSAVDDTARWMVKSQNTFLQRLGVIFMGIESPTSQGGKGCSMSTCWPIYAQYAGNFCADLESRCGWQTGYELCRQYLYFAHYKNANSNGLALYWLQTLDAWYPQCH